MRLPFALFTVIIAANPSLGQHANPYSSILEAPTEIQLSDTDERMTALLKESYNATHAELRTRYNFWLQGVGDIAGLLDSVNRFHFLRLEIEGDTDARRFAEQRLAFAKEIEAHTAKGKSKSPFEALRDIDECRARSFRVAAELELDRLTLASPAIAVGPQDAAPLKPASFRDVLEAGTTVLLKTSTDNPLYTIQLLSDEQTKKVEETFAKDAELKHRMNSIRELLRRGQSLDQRAALLKEMHDLEASVVPSSRQRLSIGSPYQVRHVGEDYVALTAGTIEMFVPFGSIRHVRRGEVVLPTASISSGALRSFQRGSSARTTSRVQLRNIDAGELANIIKKLYPDVSLNITVDTEHRTLVLESPDGADLLQIEQLIRSLEEHVDATERAQPGGK